MKWLAFFVLFSASFYFGYYGMSLIYSKYHAVRVLAKTIEPNPSPTTIPVTSSPTPSPTSTPTSTPSPTLTPTHTPSPTPTHIPQPKLSSQEIHSLMERFAGQYGVDVNVLRHIATCESGFNQTAVNGVYAGLYQFNVTTWKNNRSAMGEDVNPDLRFNAEESIQTAAYLISKGKYYLWPNCKP